MAPNDRSDKVARILPMVGVEPWPRYYIGMIRKPVSDEVATSRRVLVRDFFILQLKLVLDGLKDLALFNASFVALVIDLIVDPRHGRRFYALLRLGERFDLWLNLYRPARAAERGGGGGDGLFGVSPAGAPTFLGKLEQAVRGGDGPSAAGDAPDPPETRE